ncbi:MFS transporter [Pendulispora brunnea]|uniref:MFS transporter n=1 Tax=Pendulispora brunnea TaxID=2905690 RepID=A0ABZ2KB70_9BACT
MPQKERVLAFAFVTVFLDLVGFGIIIPLLPFYVKSMGGTAETVGFILSSFSLTQLLLTPVLGRLSDRVGRRRVILVSLAGNAVSMALFALATKVSLLPLLFISRIVAGATSGNIAACQAAIADVTDAEDRTKGMGRIGAGVGLGMVLGPVLGSAASHFGEWAPPLVASALALADFAAAFFFMPETRRPESVSLRDVTGATDQRPSLWEAISQRGILIVFALYFLTFLYLSTINVTLPLITNVRLGWTEREIGHVFGLFGLIMLVIQGGLIGRMSRAWGARRLIIAGSVCAMCGLLVVAWSGQVAAVVVGLVLLGAGLGVINPCLSTLAAELAGSSRRGAILGFAQSAGGLARTLGPTAAGILYARIGPSAPFTSGAGAALVSITLASVFLRPRKPA